MPILHQPIIVKQPQWADAVEAAIEAGALDVVAAEPTQPPETTPQPAATA